MQAPPQTEPALLQQSEYLVNHIITRWLILGHTITDTGKYNMKCTNVTIAVVGGPLNIPIDRDFNCGASVRLASLYDLLRRYYATVKSYLDNLEQIWSSNIPLAGRHFKFEMRSGLDWCAHLLVLFFWNYYLTSFSRSSLIEHRGSIQIAATHTLKSDFSVLLKPFHVAWPTHWACSFIRWSGRTSMPCAWPISRATFTAGLPSRRVA